MKVLDISREQLNSPGQGQVLEKFSDYFDEIGDFGPEDPNYLQRTRKRVDKIEEPKVREARNLLGEIADEKVNRVKKEINAEYEPGLVIFVGTGVPDGHGILVDGDPWVVIDLKTFIDRLESYDQEIYLAHEIAHAFHYASSPSFYFGNDQKFLVRPPIFKMMVAEGLATYVSSLVTPGTISDAYWFGQYSQEKVEEWTDVCEKERSRVADKMDIGKNAVSSELVEELFDVTDRHLGKSRMGYYYGTKIVQNVIEKRNLEVAFSMELTEYRDYIFCYFDF